MVRDGLVAVLLLLRRRVARRRVVMVRGGPVLLSRERTVLLGDRDDLAMILLLRSGLARVLLLSRKRVVLFVARNDLTMVLLLRRKLTILLMGRDDYLTTVLPLMSGLIIVLLPSPRGLQAPVHDHLRCWKRCKLLFRVKVQLAMEAIHVLSTLLVVNSFRLMVRDHLSVAWCFTRYLSAAWLSERHEIPPL
jgi:hypothetical protein